MKKLDLHIGVPVHTRDRECGHLAKVVIEPKTQQVSDLIVRKGLILKKAWVIPVAKVARTTPFKIQLDLDYEEFKGYARYREVDVTEPAPSAGGVSSYGLASGFGSGTTTNVPTIRRRVRKGVATGTQILGRKTGIENVAHALGNVDHVILDRDTGQISDVVLRKGLFPTYYMVPASKIEEVQEHSILVSLSDDELSTLPQYVLRDDTDILEAILGALLSEKTPAFHRVKPNVEGGIVHLAGTVSSQSVKSHAEEMVRLVPGVIDVENDLHVKGLPSSFGPISYDVPIADKHAAQPGVVRVADKK